jgi:toxin ParE1/3/4
MSSHDPRIALSDEAREDLTDIVLHGIDLWGEAVAARYTADLYETFDHLARFPNLGRIKEGVPNDIRTLGHGQHVIYYRALEDLIVILRVLHSRMDATHYLDL